MWPWTCHLLPLFDDIKFIYNRAFLQNVHLLLKLNTALTSTKILTWVPAGMGKRGHLFSLENVLTLDSLQLQHFGSHKKNQNHYHKTRFMAQNIPQPRTTLGSSQHSHRPLAVFKGFSLLVWRKGNINKNCLCVTVLCTITMVHKDTSSSYRLVDCIGLWSCLV